jgi:hypothetical protein
LIYLPSRKYRGWKYKTREEARKANNEHAKAWMKKIQAAGFTQRKGPDGKWHYVLKASKKFLKGKRPSRLITDLE